MDTTHEIGRTRGLSWPPNSYQLSLVVVILALLAIDTIQLMTGIWSDHILRVISILHILASTISLELLRQTSWVDPRLIAGEDDVAVGLYCTICQRTVPIGTRHCRTCDKCVMGFDHHCIWLNTCIGERNYQRFRLLLIFSIGSLLTLIAQDIYMWSHKHITFYLGGYGQLWRELLNAAQFTIGIVGVYAVGLLLSLHIVLRWKGLTTYEFIRMQKELEQFVKINENIRERIQREEEDVVRVGICSGWSFDGRNCAHNVPLFYPWLAWSIRELLANERAQYATVDSRMDAFDHTRKCIRHHPTPVMERELEVNDFCPSKGG